MADDASADRLADIQLFSRAISSGVSIRSTDDDDDALQLPIAKIVYALDEIPIGVQFETKRKTLLRRLSVNELQIAHVFLVRHNGDLFLLSDTQYNEFRLTPESLSKFAPHAIGE